MERLWRPGPAKGSGWLSPHSALLKPNPHLVNQAVRSLEVPPSNCTLIGGPLTDLCAAHTARTRAIGYANKPGNAGIESVRRQPSGGKSLRFRLGL